LVTIIGCPKGSVTIFARIRMVKSDDPPAEKGIITVIALLGNFSAATVTAEDTTKRPTRIAITILPLFIIAPPLRIIS